MMESSKEGVASRGEEGGREAAGPGEGNPFPALEALSRGLVVDVVHEARSRTVAG